MKENKLKQKENVAKPGFRGNGANVHRINKGGNQRFRKTHLEKKNFGQIAMNVPCKPLCLFTRQFYMQWTLPSERYILFMNLFTVLHIWRVFL